MSCTSGPKIIKDSSLVLNLDANNIKSYPGSGNNWYDLSKQKNHCTLQTGTAVFSNGGIYFDMGTFWRGSDTGFNFSTNPSTQIVWSRPATVTANKIMFYYGTANGTTGAARGLEILSTSNYRFWGFNSDQDSGLAMSLNTWNMAVAVYDGSSPNQSTYLNDKTGATGSLGWNTISTGYYYVGADTGYAVGTRAWYGNISIVMVYNRILSLSEIIQNYNAIKGRFGY